MTGHNLLERQFAALERALAALRTDWMANGFDPASETCRAFLDAAADLTEIDALRAAADAIPDEDFFGNTLPSRESRVASHFFDQGKAA